MAVTEFYRNRRVLVTGLNGFKGLWLGTWLQELGAEVAGLGLETTREMDASWPQWRSRFHFEQIDIRDSQAVAGFFEEVKPHVVFHLAAQPLVRLSYHQPSETFHTNVQGTVHVLEAARKVESIESVVVVTTDKCYENREWYWSYKEIDPLGGHDPYSSSKACAELVTQAYQRSFCSAGLAPPIGSARAGNVIGGGDWAQDRLVPDIVRSLAAGQAVEIRRPHAIRPWQHVLEPLSGYLMLGQALAQNTPGAVSAWNFGPYESEIVTVGELASAILECWGTGEVRINADADDLHEAKYLKLDSSKAAAELRWHPLLSCAERISWTVDWYKSGLKDSQQAWEFTRHQIREFQSHLESKQTMAERWHGRQVGGTAKAA